MLLKNKIQYLIEKTNEGMFEREEVIKLAFLAMLSGESIFMLGLPGVAKSMIARKMKFTLKDGKEFEYLMNRFSTPEEIFGPISLTKLDEDKYERAVDGYLPTADIAFLDEIWKASPSIQNTLLTIINEKLFRNGSKDINVPLKLLIAASNELPAEGEGLEALYDRFLIRYYVDPINKEDHFNKLVTSSNDSFDIDKKYLITLSDIEEVQNGFKNILVKKDMLDFISKFRKNLYVKMKEKAPYISDRRWKKIVKLLRINAYVSGREKVEPADLLILPHAVWENKEQQTAINSIFNELWIDAVTLKTGVSLIEIKNNISEAKELSDTGFIFSQVHQSYKVKGYGDNKMHEYFAYTMQNNQYKFWIPLDSNKNIISDYSSPSDRFYCYYTGKLAKTLNRDNTSSETQYIRNWDLNNNIYNGSRKITPVMQEEKTKDIKKLEESKTICDANSLLISNIKNKIESEITKLEKTNSLFTENYIAILTKAKAAILDSLNKFNSDNNTILGAVVTNMKK